MMIYGIGTDIIDAKRVARLYKRFGEAFARRILSQPEWMEWIQTPPSDPVKYLAKRFAAKEALSKAVRVGLRSPVTFSNIAVIHDSNGRPEFLYQPALEKWLQDRKIGTIHVTISDEGAMIVAFAVAENAR